VALIGETFVQVRADTDRFTRDASDGIEKASAGISEKVGHHFAAIGAAIGGAFALNKVIEFGKGAIEGALEMQAATRVTEQVIKTTGGAANVTAAQLDSLSTHLSNLTGVDDDVIHSSENLILTFTAVRNTVGDGNDIFSQATSAALDMSTAFHEDLNSATIQLGKALQDPIAGATRMLHEDGDALRPLATAWQALRSLPRR
jgi:hypothetical protein